MFNISEVLFISISTFLPVSPESKLKVSSFALKVTASPTIDESSIKFLNSIAFISIDTLKSRDGIFLSISSSSNKGIENFLFEFPRIVTFNRLFECDKTKVSPLLTLFRACFKESKLIVIFEGSVTLYSMNEDGNMFNITIEIFAGSIETNFNPSFVT